LIPKPSGIRPTRDRLAAAKRRLRQTAVENCGWRAPIEYLTVRLEKAPGASADAALVAQARIVSAIATVLGRLVEAKDRLDPGAPIAEDAATTRLPRGSSC
jgi:hypothetical protein